MPRTAEKNPEISALIQQAEDSDEAQIVRIYKEIKGLAKKDKLWETKRLHPKSVAVSKHNRAGFICSGVVAHQVGEVVINVGYDTELCKDATAWEVEDDGSSVKLFLDIVANDEHLARYTENDIDAISVACSHFNQFLAATIESRPTPSANVRMQVDGRLSKSACLEFSPAMSSAFEGLDWTLWSKESAILYPKLPDIAQRALNAKFNGFQDEHNFHHYQRAHLVLNTQACKASGGENAHVLRDIIRSAPKNVDDIPAIVDFACKYGTSAQIVQPVMSWVRGGYMPAGRIVPARIFKAMATVPFEPKDTPPLFMNSILMFLAASPASKVVGKEATWIGVGDVGHMNSPKKLALVKEAEHAIGEALKVSQSMQLPAQVELKLVGNLRVALVGKVFDKMPAYTDKTIPQIAREFYDRAAEKAVVKDVASPWPALEIARASGSSSTSGTPSSVINYDDEGKPVGLGLQSVLHRGFQIGGYCKTSSGASSISSSSPPSLF